MEKIRVTRLCPTCNCDEGFLLKEIPLILPVGHPFENHYRAMLCGQCTTIFCDTAITDKELNEFYASLAKYQDKVVGTGGSTSPFELERFRKLAEVVIQQASSKDLKVLDIGCANGGALLALKANGFHHLYGIDPSPVCAQTTREASGASTLAGGIYDIVKFETKFDVILLSHVVEHLLEPAKALSFVRDHLTEDGVLYVEVPDPAKFYKYETTPFQEFNTEHINHFGETALTALVESCGFETMTCAAGLNQIGQNIDYPVLRGVWKKSPATAENFRFDETLLTTMHEYTRKSDEALAAIEAYLALNIQNKKFTLWGAGQFCYKLLGRPVFESKAPNQIIDNNSINWGRKLAGVSIQKSSEFDANTDLVIVASMINSKPIADQILKISNHIKVLNLGSVECELNRNKNRIDMK